MATGGIISAPVAGPLLERTGAIRVERGTELARHAVRVTEVALVQGGHVVAYPEGRVGLDRRRLARARPHRDGPDGPRPRRPGDPGQPVGRPRGPPVRQRLGQAAHGRPGGRPPARACRCTSGRRCRLDDLQMGRVGDANRARYRIAAAITRGLVPLRAGEAERPHFVDPHPADDGGRGLPRRRRPGRHPVTRIGDDCPSVLDPAARRLGTCARDHCAARHRTPGVPCPSTGPQAGTLRLVLLRLGDVGLQHLGDDRLPRPVPDLDRRGGRRRRRAASTRWASASPPGSLLRLRAVAVGARPGAGAAAHRGDRRPHRSQAADARGVRVRSARWLHDGDVLRRATSAICSAPGCSSSPTSASAPPPSSTTRGCPTSPRPTTATPSPAAAGRSATSAARCCWPSTWPCSPSTTSLGLTEGEAVRICLASAGIWWAGFTVVSVSLLRNRRPRSSSTATGPTGQGPLAAASGSWARRSGAAPRIR